MQKIYASAKAVLSWLGPDTKDHQAVVAMNSILTISDFLCQKLKVTVSGLRSISNIYQELVLKTGHISHYQMNATSVQTRLGSL